MKKLTHPGDLPYPGPDAANRHPLMICAALVLLLLLVPSPALAYVDVTGSYLLTQLVLAGVAGVMVVFRIFAARIRSTVARWAQWIAAR